MWYGFGEWEKYLKGLSDQEIERMVANSVVPTEAQLEEMQKQIEGWRERIDAQKARLAQEGLSEEEIKNHTDPTVSFSLGVEEEIQTFLEYHRRHKIRC